MARPRGFTLVEVMVAMVIGMIGIIIMMQVFASAEGQKRTTTGTGDAQSNGAMAIYTLQRDIREAGYGFNAMNALGCALVLPAPASRTLTPAGPGDHQPANRRRPCRRRQHRHPARRLRQRRGLPGRRGDHRDQRHPARGSGAGKFSRRASRRSSRRRPVGAARRLQPDAGHGVGRRRPERQCSRQWRC
ncbi:MAG: prepilin-type N-terminal cleavage/methylation domain-containing protein [Candidatus Accumulibacter sp.]|nr:prepilin-type N-terminal cleavage/methylation domain-containing protein [Accumulibacter sp.]